MTKNRKSLFFIISFFIILIALIIYRYEKLLVQTRNELSFEHVAGAEPGSNRYNAQMIVDLIYKSKEYLGDSVTIFDNGSMASSNNKFQGTIQAVIESKDNMNIVKNNIATNKLPIQYNIYILAATFYRDQYPSEVAPSSK